MSTDTLICAVCHGEAQLVKVGAFDICNDPRCADVAKAWGGTFPPDEMVTHWEKDATAHAASQAGRYLDQHDMPTDLAALSRDQYLEFASVMLLAYRCKLRELAMNGAPPL